MAASERRSLGMSCLRLWWLYTADVDGTTVTESQVVVEYLEERYKDSGTQLIPNNPAHAAKVSSYNNIGSAKAPPQHAPHCGAHTPPVSRLHP